MSEIIIGALFLILAGSNITAFYFGVKAGKQEEIFTKVDPGEILLDKEDVDPKKITYSFED